MGKPKPAAAGGTTVPAAEQLAALEAELAMAKHDPHDEEIVQGRNELEEHLDELRTAARLEADQQRAADLAAQEAANFALAHGEPLDDPAPPDAGEDLAPPTPAPAQAPATVETSGE